MWRDIWVCGQAVIAVLHTLAPKALRLLAVKKPLPWLSPSPCPSHRFSRWCAWAGRSHQSTRQKGPGQYMDLISATTCNNSCSMPSGQGPRQLREESAKRGTPREGPFAKFSPDERVASDYMGPSLPVRVLNMPCFV